MLFHFNFVHVHQAHGRIYAGGNSGKCRVTTAGPRTEASPTTLNFGPTTIGHTNERRLVVQNTGSATLSNSLAISNAVCNPRLGNI